MTFSSSRISILTAAVMSIFLHSAAQAAFIQEDMGFLNKNYQNQTSDGSYFIFSTTNVGASGSGAVDAFLRVQATGSEQGYNSDFPGEFDEKAGVFTRTLLWSEVSTGTGTFIDPAFTSDDLGELVMDSNDGGDLSINQIQIFAATSAYASQDLSSFTTITTFLGGADGLQTYNEISFADDPLTVGLIDVVEVFQLSDAALQYEILVDSSFGNGSGTFDIRFLFDLDAYQLLDPTIYTNLIFYVQLGSPPGSEGTSSTFEEWAVVSGDRSVFIPEPSTWAMMLIAACGAVFFQYRQQRKLKLAAAQASDC